MDRFNKSGLASLTTSSHTCLLLALASPALSKILSPSSCRTWCSPPAPPGPSAPALHRGPFSAFLFTQKFFFYYTIYPHDSLPHCAPIFLFHVLFFKHKHLYLYGITHSLVYGLFSQFLEEKLYIYLRLLLNPFLLAQHLR